MKYPKLKEVYRDFQKNLGAFSKSDQRTLRKAFAIAKEQHKKQKKFGLYTYIIHPLVIFNFLYKKFDIRDVNILASSLLHDTVEDGTITHQEIRSHFGEGVYKIVRVLTRFRETGETEKEKMINKEKHFKKVAKSGRGAIIIMLADEYDNMKNWFKIPSDNQNRKKFPRWIKEAEKHLRLAKRTDGKMFKIIDRELYLVKRHLLDEKNE